MHLELQRADRVRDAFDVIAQAVREVVHRVDAPLGASMMMLGVADAVEDRVAHPDVRRRHVNLRAQRARAIREFAGLHPGEEIEVLLDGAGAERAVLARAVGCAAVRVGVLGGEIIHVGHALLDELQGVFVGLVEVIAGVERLQRAVGWFPLSAAGRSRLCR